MLYFCPRCTIAVPKKYSLQSHFSRKKPCDAKNNIILTNEVKEKALVGWENISDLLSSLNSMNEERNQQQYVKIHNDIFQILYNIDIQNKYDILLNHLEIPKKDIINKVDMFTRINDLCFSDLINVYNDHIISSKTESLYSELTASDFIIIFRKAICFNISSKKDIEKQLLNIICVKDDFYDDFYYYDNSEWVNCNMDYLLNHLLGHFTLLLTTYEKYIIKAIYTIPPHNFTHIIAKNRLDNFYKMISQFRDKPFVKGMNDIDIFENNECKNFISNYDTRIVNECVQKFNEIKQNLSTIETLQLLKNAIKDVSQTNTDFINKHLFVQMSKNTNLFDKVKSMQSEKKDNLTTDIISPPNYHEQNLKLKLFIYNRMKNHINKDSIFRMKTQFTSPTSSDLDD